MGRHPEFTRVVLETDVPAAHELDTSRPDEIRLEIAAESGLRAIRRDVPLLEAVRVEPADAGRSTVRLLLEGPARAETMVLSSPHRVVIDLREAPPGEATTAAAEPAERAEPEEAEEPGEPAEAAEPTEAAERGAGAPAAASEAADPDAAPEDELSGEPSRAEPGAAPEEETAGEAEGEPGASERPGAVSPPRPGASPADPPTPPDGPGTPETPDTTETTPPGDEAAGTGAPPSPAQRGPLSMLPAPLDRPVVLAGLVLLLLFVALLGAARRRSRAAEEEGASLSPFEAGEAPEEPPAAAGLEREHAARTEAGGALGSEPAAEPAFGSAPEPAGRHGVAGAEAATATGPAADLAPEPGGSAAAGGGVAALEERVARMEARVEELTDAKERLERQVAAQTEELRVQRAAIARTQRVLRTVARPDDEASEPAPKS